MKKEEKLLFFGPGEWIEEPDFLEWEDRGIWCSIYRGSTGSLCGYAELYSSHPWRGSFYKDIEVQVHGGLAYCKETKQESVIGFHCAHLGDLCPYLNNSFGNSVIYHELEQKHGKQIYKNIEFVKNELKNLVTQILQAVK